MGANSRELLAALALAVCPWIPSLAAETSFSELIELCDLRVPDSVASANASFSVVYSIKLDQDGKPVRVMKVRNDFLLDTPLVSCLRGWRLPPEYGVVLVTLNWEHGKGWTQLSIAGKGVDRVMRFHPAWCVK